MLRVGTVPLEGHRKLMSKETTTRVVLADDHDVVRQGLKRLLDRVPGIEVVADVSDGLQALQSVQELHPDVLLLDIEMPVMDGIEVARQLQKSNVKVRILILSAYDDREYIRALLDIGVAGYLVKGEAPGKIVEAVRGVAQGQKGWVSPQVRKKLNKIHDITYKRVKLSDRERKILQLLAAGVPDRVIAREVTLSEEETVDSIQALLKKIGALTREEAVEISIREGWLSASEAD